MDFHLVSKKSLRPIYIALIYALASTGEEKNNSDEARFPVSFGAEADLASAYYWHGVELSRTPALHPDLWASACGWTLEAWGTKDVSGENNDGELIVGYEREWGGFTASSELEWYFYPAEDDAGELSLKLECPISGPLGAYTKQSVLLWGASFDYIGETGLSLNWERSERLSIEAESGLMWASASFNDNNHGVNAWALNHWETRLSATWRPFAIFYIRPHAEVLVIIDKRVRESKTVLPVAGFAAGIEF